MSEVISFTLSQQGDEIALKIGSNVIERYSRAALEKYWQDDAQLVLIMATPAAIRIIAPLIGEKGHGPSVVTIDASGTFVTPILGAHTSANQLARQLGAILSATPVITTSSDTTNTPALDAFRGFYATGDLPRAIALMTLGSRPQISNPHHFKLPLTLVPGNDDIEIVISQNPSEIQSFLDRQTTSAKVALIPKNLILGVGCSSNATTSDVLRLLKTTLAEAQLDERAISKVATIDSRSKHDAITGLGIDIVSYSRADLNRVETPNPSPTVSRFMGTPSVCEAAAMLAGHTRKLTVEKRKSENVTVAITQAQKSGRLFLVGLGPGEKSLRTPAATQVITSVDAIIGFEQYVDSVSELFSPNQLIERSPIGSERERAARAIELCTQGYDVAILGSGDPGIYALASLTLELLAQLDIDDIQFSVVPGITAALSASSILGAPLGHDHCYISLSDLLTPWSAIEKRISHAAQGDFVCVFYNPKSKTRNWQLDRAIEILLQYRPPSTPIGYVREAYRKDQSFHVTTLADFKSSTIDMNTVVIVGSTNTFLDHGKMITPRGYLEPTKERS